MVHGAAGLTVSPRQVLLVVYNTPAVSRGDWTPTFNPSGNMPSTEYLLFFFTAKFFRSVYPVVVAAVSIAACSTSKCYLVKHAPWHYLRGLHTDCYSSSSCCYIHTYIVTVLRTTENIGNKYCTYVYGVLRTYSGPSINARQGPRPI